MMGYFCDGCTTLADVSQDRMLHIALWCLEGTTMSNRRTPERSGGVLGHQPISTDAAWRAVPQRTGSPSVIRGLTPSASAGERYHFWLRWSLFPDFVIVSLKPTETF
ncbi:MAG: hypothetical protein ACI4UA_04435 [Bacteroidaceae bacterium]